MAGVQVLNERGQMVVNIREGDGLYHPRLGLGIICQTENRHFQLIMVGSDVAQRLNTKRPVSYSKLNTKGGFEKLVFAEDKAKATEWRRVPVSYVPEV